METGNEICTRKEAIGIFQTTKNIYFIFKCIYILFCFVFYIQSDLLVNYQKKKLFTCSNLYITYRMQCIFNLRRPRHSRDSYDFNLFLSHVTSTYFNLLVISFHFIDFSFVLFCHFIEKIK